MEHIAIDLGGRLSQICVRGSDGKIVAEKRIATRALAEYLAARSPSRIVMETCGEAFGIADAALELGHEVRVVPATLVRSLGVGARRTKTDRRDAQVLSEASCRIDLPSVHVPSMTSRRRKSECGMREALVESRTRLINTVHGWLRGQTFRVKPGSTRTFHERVREAAAQEATPLLPRYIDRQLETIEHLTTQILEADEELAREADADPVCRRLMSVPGVGPVTAIRFTAALDEVSRFSSAHKVEAYLGLVPGEHSSSDRVRRTGITKAGSVQLRAVLVQAAWAARRARNPHPMVQWSLEVEKRRGKHVAITALARKLAGILFAIWRDNSTYDPTHRPSTWREVRFP